MLGDGEPVPHRIRGYNRPLGIFTEISQEVSFEVRENGAQTGQTVRKTIVRARHAPEGDTRTETFKCGLPGSRIQRVL